MKRSLSGPVIAAKYTDQNSETIPLALLRRDDPTQRMPPWQNDAAMIHFHRDLGLTRRQRSTFD